MDLCSECKYYDSYNGSGRCKIEHPELSPKPGTTGEWPVVQGDNKACGQFDATP